MTRRFSSGELNFLRNRVPIGRVVKNLFGTSIQDSSQRFVCPICGGPDTSVNAGHNLARCFSCRRNFNPIELVMHQLKISFVDSVKWLQGRMPSSHQYTPATNKTDNAGPCAIGDILSHVIPSLPPNEASAPSMESIVKRISHLEHRLRHLDRVVSELRSYLNQ
ncbi:CHC2 zinc finger domain-containing protein [Desulfosarcina cetonica]|uniref:CHC2 zinc finger domain-containing protein n=1 Tax=Desulfosarcina cetonica TaxID=90730 RepID=UPI0012ECC26A